MAFAFTHTYGALYGLLFVIVWNYVCSTIAFSFVFLVARYFIGDFVYYNCIRNQEFCKFSKAVKT